MECPLLITPAGRILFASRIGRSPQPPSDRLPVQGIRGLPPLPGISGVLTPAVGPRRGRRHTRAARSDPRAARRFTQGCGLPKGDGPQTSSRVGRPASVPRSPPSRGEGSIAPETRRQSAARAPSLRFLLCSAKRSKFHEDNRLVDPLVLKKKISRPGNAGDLAVLSSLLCYITELAGWVTQKKSKTTPTSDITSSKAIVITKHLGTNNSSNINSTAKRPTRFQLLQSKFMNPNREHPIKRTREVGKLIFKEKQSVSKGGISINIYKVDRTREKKEKDTVEENKMASDRIRWTHPAGKNAVKNILRKFIAAEEKEKENTGVKKEKSSKRNLPKIISKNSVLAKLKEKFEQTSSLCSVTELNTPLAPPRSKSKRKEPKARQLCKAEIGELQITTDAATHINRAAIQQMVCTEVPPHSFHAVSIINCPLALLMCSTESVSSQFVSCSAGKSKQAGNTPGNSLVVLNSEGTDATRTQVLERSESVCVGRVKPDGHFAEEPGELTQLPKPNKDSFESAKISAPQSTSDINHTKGTSGNWVKDVTRKAPSNTILNEHGVQSVQPTLPSTDEFQNPLEDMTEKVQPDQFIEALSGPPDASNLGSNELWGTDSTVPPSEMLPNKICDIKEANNGGLCSTNNTDPGKERPKAMIAEMKHSTSLKRTLKGKGTEKAQANTGEKNEVTPVTEAGHRSTKNVEPDNESHKATRKDTEHGKPLKRAPEAQFTGKAQTNTGEKIEVTQVREAGHHSTKNLEPDNESHKAMRKDMEEGKPLKRAPEAQFAEKAPTNTGEKIEVTQVREAGHRSTKNIEPDNESHKAVKKDVVHGKPLKRAPEAQFTEKAQTNTGETIEVTQVKEAGHRSTKNTKPGNDQAKATDMEHGKPLKRELEGQVIEKAETKAGGKNKGTQITEAGHDSTKNTEPDSERPNAKEGDIEHRKQTTRALEVHVTQKAETSNSYCHVDIAPGTKIAEEQSSAGGGNAKMAAKSETQFPANMEQPHKIPEISILKRANKKQEGASRVKSELIGDDTKHNKEPESEIPGVKVLGGQDREQTDTLVCDEPKVRDTFKDMTDTEIDFANGGLSLASALESPSASTDRRAPAGCTADTTKQSENCVYERSMADSGAAPTFWAVAHSSIVCQPKPLTSPPLLVTPSVSAASTHKERIEAGTTVPKNTTEGREPSSTIQRTHSHGAQNIITVEKVSESIPSLSHKHARAFYNVEPAIETFRAVPHLSKVRQTPSVAATKDSEASTKKGLPSLPGNGATHSTHKHKKTPTKSRRSESKDVTKPKGSLAKDERKAPKSHTLATQGMQKGQPDAASQQQGKRIESSLDTPKRATSQKYQVPPSDEAGKHRETHEVEKTQQLQSGKPKKYRAACNDAAGVSQTAKYKAESYGENNNPTQTFKPLVVRASDTFKRCT
ncbi:hypothetical protein NDU88_005802 [Pleurodeles waltl]|uniref:Uncharacterized protein n=1 Tax=Pleurodeles waltl TaxID=8319 RepID=A0AAV7NXL6_PLEWA|nr:hypothetical protein NDU88_005802 [Pleurodeles waltl]